MDCALKLYLVITVGCKCVLIFQLQGKSRKKNKRKNKGIVFSAGMYDKLYNIIIVT